jgi:hypothetical protein
VGLIVQWGSSSPWSPNFFNAILYLEISQTPAATCSSGRMTSSWSTCDSRSLPCTRSWFRRPSSVPSPTGLRLARNPSKTIFSIESDPVRMVVPIAVSASSTFERGHSCEMLTPLAMPWVCQAVKHSIYGNSLISASSLCYRKPATGSKSSTYKNHI